MAKILHYLNQFFAGIGGEDKAGQEFLFLPQPVGPGNFLCDLLKSHAPQYATIVCGDNYFNEQEETALASLTQAMTRFQPDLFIAGPAFHAGRYGIACAKTASFVRKRWNIPTLTGMFEENPGTREIGRHVYVIQTGPSATSMQPTLKRYAELATLLLEKKFGDAERFKEEHCFKIPRRFTVETASPDYERAVAMLLAKLRGKSFETEIPRVDSAPHAIPPAIENLTGATLALVTEGGMVPKGNPDRLESSRGTKYFKYSINGRDDLREGEFEAMHTGYDTSTVNQDPDRLVPLDALRRLERAGQFARLHDYYYVTTGPGAMPAKMQEIGAGIAAELSTAGVTGVILTAT